MARPEVPRGYADRPRLRVALSAKTRGPVTVVTGGPGWGKTLLVAAWAASADASRSICWLTLDADDDEPRAFWSYLLAALRRSGAVRADNPLAARWTPEAASVATRSAGSSSGSANSARGGARPRRRLGDPQRRRPRADRAAVPPWLPLRVVLVCGGDPAAAAPAQGERRPLPVLTSSASPRPRQPSFSSGKGSTARRWLSCSTAPTAGRPGCACRYVPSAPGCTGGPVQRGGTFGC